MADQNFNIVIRAIDNFESAFQGMKKQFDKLNKWIDGYAKRWPLLTKAIQKSAQMISSAISGIAKFGAVSIAAFGYFIKRNIEAIDTMGKLATSIGTTVTTLSKLEYSASLSGVEVTQLSASLKGFVRKTAEAAKGTGETVASFKRLGLSAKDLQKLNLDEQLLIVADALGNVTNSGDKAAIAVKLFEEGGVGLLNMFEGGSKALREMWQEADTLGLVLSHGAYEGVAKANDALTRLWSLITGLARQVTSALAPVIELLATQMKDWALSMVDPVKGMKSIGESIAKYLVRGLVVALQAVQGIVQGVQIAIREIAAFGNAVKRYINGDEISEVTSQIETLQAELNRLQGISNGSDNQFRIISEQAQAENAERVAELGTQIDSLKAKLTELRGTEGAEAPLFSLQPTIDQVLALGSAIGSLSLFEGMEPIKATGAFNPSWWESIKIKAGEFKDSIAETYNTLGENGALFNFQSDMNNLVSGSINAVTDGFMNAITGAESFGDAMKGMAKSVIDSLIKMYIQYMIVKPLFDMMFPNAAPPTSPSSTLAPRAIGGSVQSGQPYMVGERGPELFVPNSQGSIVPNKNMGGDSGGIVINQTINVTTGVQQTVRAEIATLMPQIANAAKSAVADARMRGGSYSKSLVGA